MTRLLLCAGLALAASACRPASEGARPPEDRDPTASVATQTDGPSPPPAIAARSTEKAVNPEIAKLVEQLRALNDVRRFALATEQIPPIDFKPAEHRATPFPSKTFTRVVGFSVNAGFQSKGGSECTSAVSATGTLCPNVVLPGAPLDAPQVQRLLAIAPQPPERVTTCATLPSHAWVFYDGDLPVAELIVSFGCGTWSRSDYVLQPEQLVELRRLCRQSGMLGCDAGAREERGALWDAAVAEWTERDFEPSLFAAHQGPMARRLRPLATGIDQQERLVDLSDREKRLLCRWNLQHSVWRHRAGSGFGFFEDDQRYVVEVHRLSDCVAAFPTCEHTLAELSACVDWAQRGDPWFRMPQVASCRAQRSCVWGYSTAVHPCDKHVPNLVPCAPGVK